jgi:uncharacterized protein YecT (DUF1311 family)
MVAKKSNNFEFKTKNMKKIAYIAAITGALFISPDAKDSKNHCAGKLSSYESLACTKANYDSTDKKLNSIYKATKALLSKKQVELLVKSQKGWLQLRDNQCALETFADQGTGKEERRLECLIENTSNRIRQIESTPTDSTFN